MKCATCGQEYGVAHNCAGVVAAADVSDVPAPPSGFALFHYIGEAFRIATWDDSAIRRTMNDRRAIVYGIIVYALVAFFQLLIPVAQLLLLGRIEHSIIVASSFAIILLSAAFLDFLRVAICHGLSVFFAGGTGKFKQLFGPLLLGSIVNDLALIPLVGPLAAALAWICVFAMVFQEVHGIAPLTAFLFSSAVGVAIFLIGAYVAPHLRAVGS